MTFGMVPNAALDPAAESRLRALRQLLDLRMELMRPQMPPESAELSSADIARRRICDVCGAVAGYKQGSGREKVAVLLQSIDLDHYTAAFVANGYVSSADLSDADDEELSELVQRLCMKRPEERRLLKAVTFMRAELAERAAALPTTPRKENVPAAAPAPAGTDISANGGESVESGEEATAKLAPDEVINATRIIQARHRGRVARHHVDEMRSQQIDAALRIQSVQRGRVARKHTSKKELCRVQAPPEPMDE